LAGISLPIWQWRSADRQISSILDRYHLSGAELHTAWILRSYVEQARIPQFSQLASSHRRAAVQRERNRELLRLQRTQNRRAYRQQKKTFSHTKPYIHLTRDERRQLIRDVADCVSQWGFARLFAECVDKLHFDPALSTQTVDEQAFEQVVSRFERYLGNTEVPTQRNYGLLVHDNNHSVAKRHTALNTHGRGQPPRMHETVDGLPAARAVARLADSGGGCKIGSLSGGKGRGPRKGCGLLPRYLN